MVQNRLIEIGSSTELQEPAPQVISKVVERRSTIRVTWGMELQRGLTKCDSFLQICYGSLLVVPGTEASCKVME